MYSSEKSGIAKEWEAADGGAFAPSVNERAQRNATQRNATQRNDVVSTHRIKWYVCVVNEAQT